jgi:hypothetical protein
MLAARLALAGLLGAAIMAALDRFDRPPPMPLVHAAFPICEGNPAPDGDDSAPGAIDPEQAPQFDPDAPELAKPSSIA